MAEIELTEANFREEVLRSDLPVIVDVWAPWRAPCLMATAAVDELAREYGGKLKVGTLNVDEASSIAVEYGVLNLPTLAIFKNGEVVERIIGALPKAQIDSKIRPHVGPDSE